MRERIYRIIDVEDSTSYISKAYNIFNIFMILLSLLPLVFKEPTLWLLKIDKIVLIFFVIEYLLHLGTADLKYQDRSKVEAFLTYPVSFYGIVDLLSILPMVEFVSSPFRLFRLFRLFRSLRIFRVFKIFRHSSSVDLLFNSVKRQKDLLQFVLWVAILYLVISGILVFNVEPETFPTFWDAIFWAAGTLTTATVGNYNPQSIVGQLISILSAFIGILIVALPSSIITAGFLDEINEETEEEKEKRTREQKGDHGDLDKDE